MTLPNIEPAPYERDLESLGTDERLALLAELATLPFEQARALLAERYPSFDPRSPMLLAMAYASDGIKPLRASTVPAPYAPQVTLPKRGALLTPFEKQKADEALRRHCLATLYTLGASWGSLAILFERTREAIRASGRKGLAGHDSNGERYVAGSRASLPFEHVSHYLNAYRENMDTLRALSVDDAAAWLRDNVALEDLTTL